MIETLDIKYRPKTYEEVIGQKSAIGSLKGDLVRSYIFTGPSGVGKAQPLYSKILTPEGYVTMGDVKLGDKVFTDTGDTAPITGVFPQGVRPIYEITLQDRTKIRVSDHHLNKIHYSKTVGPRDKRVTVREYKVVTTLELIDLFKRGKRKLRIDTPSVDFPEQELLIDPYLLGTIIGDGGVSGNNMMFSNADEDVLIKVGDILKNDYEMELRHRSNHDYRISYIDEVNHAGNRGNRGLHDISRNYDYEKTLRGKLEKLGLNVKSKSKFIPKEYLINSRDNRLKLLQGLMDTDGYVSLQGTVEFSTSSPQLSKDFAHLARSLGIRVTVSTKIPKIGDKEYGTHYIHYLHIPNDLPFCTRSKMVERIKPRQNPQLRNIVSIDYVGEEECQCIMVGHPSHTYISDDFIPTHNTTSVRIFAEEHKAEILELDTASLGKADIEKLKENAYYKPMFNKHKFVVLDEVHNLSKQAWDSLLKVIEEGPKFLTWVLITTEPEKVPTTIRTRSRVVEFGKVQIKEILEHLEKLVTREEKEVEETVLYNISSYANGSVREAVKALETYLTTGDISIRNFQKETIELLDAVYSKDYDKIVEATEGYTAKDLELLVRVTTDYITFLLLLTTSKEKPSPTNDVGYRIMRDRTTLNPELIDNFREMQASVLGNFKMVGNNHIKVTVDSLYNLIHTLMQNYNKFQDVSTVTRGALLWFSEML